MDVKIYIMDSLPLVEWPTSSRGFFFDPNLPADSPQNMQRGEVSLDINWKELNFLIETQSPILEIGPGMFNSTKELETLGANITAIEPGLQTSDRPLIEYELEKKAIRSAIFPLKARDLIDTPEIPNNNFKLAFAVGPNFQCYQTSPYDFVEDLAGIMLKLSFDGDLVFEVQTSSKEKVVVNFIGGMFKEPKDYKIKVFNILDFLNVIEADYKTSFTQEGSHSVRIRRKTKKGEDLFIKLIESLDSDLYTFVT